MIIYTRIKYSISLIIPLILLILLSADSLADTYRIPKQSDIDKEAIEACKHAIRVNPDDAEAHYILGYVYLNLGMDKEAIDALKQAIRIEPDYANAHTCLGVAYGKSGMDKEETD